MPYDWECSPLHALSKNDKLSDRLMFDLVQLLLQSGADVNDKNEVGVSPIYSFFMHCRNDNLVDILQLLIDNGADINSWESCGSRPLHAL